MLDGMLLGFSRLDSVATVGMVPMDLMQWLHVWITPFWVIAVGLTAGLLLIAAVYGVLAALSLVPAIGSLADNRPLATGVSAAIAAVISLVLCWNYVPQVEPEKYQLHLVLPLIMVGIICGWGIVYGAWSRTRREFFQIVTEGPMPYVLGTAAVLAVIGFAGTGVVEAPRDILNSVRQVNLLDDGTEVIPIEIPGIGLDVQANQAPFVKVADLRYDPSRLTELRVESDKFVRIADAENPDNFGMTPAALLPDESVVYRVGDLKPPPVPRDSDSMYIQNTETDPATVTFTFVRKPAVEEAATIPFVGISFFLLVCAYITFRQAAPRIAAVALSTAKSEMAQPLYLVLMAGGVVAIIILGIVPFHTMGDDIKMMKDCSMTLIMVFALIQFVWSAGSTVSEEIEGRTALTVLSKPITRRGFLLGKYTGILMTVLVLFLVMGAVLLTTVSYKPIYDARETANEQPGWEVTHEEVMTTLPPLTLYFMETMAIGGIAVALATRLPLLANFITCFTVYVIGNLVGPLVASAKENTELVGFVGKLIAVVVPNLNTFNVQAALDAGNAVPLIYVAGAFNYLVVFVIAIWMLAMLLFEDRDLA